MPSQDQSAFKDMLRRPFRVFTRRLWARVDDRIALRVDELDTLKDDAATITRTLPALLNTISSQNASARQARRAQIDLEERMEAVDRRFGTVDERAATIESRGEFIRKEVLYELQHGGGTAGVQRSIEPRVINKAKLDSAGGDIRLNLGCGHIPIERYLNVDVRELDGVDIVAEVHDLPFGPREVAEIFSAHMLEHFPVEELTRRLLPYWYSLLKPGGTFVAVVPDAEMMITEYGAGRMSFEDLREVTFGDQEYEGDFHFNMFSRDSIVGLLVKQGFEDVALTETGRRNGLCYEMEVTARRPHRDVSATTF